MTADQGFTDKPTYCVLRNAYLDSDDDRVAAMLRRENTGLLKQRLWAITVRWPDGRFVPVDWQDGLPWRRQFREFR